MLILIDYSLDLASFVADDYFKLYKWHTPKELHRLLILLSKDELAVEDKIH